MTGTPIWWEEESLHFLDETLAFVNSSRSREEPIGRCDDLCKALNKTWNAYYCYRRQTGQLTATEAKGRSDAQAFTKLLLTGIRRDEVSEFCQSGSLRALADLSPQIMDHDALLKEQYDPFNIGDKVRKKASEEHEQFRKAYCRYLEAPAEESLVEALLKKTEQILFVVRCNIAHSEKTPKGPDREKAKRDCTVCETASAVIEDFFESLFDHPSHRIAVYGTLAPGKPNASVIADIKGEWKQGTVVGNVHKQDGLHAFRWTDNGNTVGVQVLVTSDLKAHLERLDQFEGPRYRRILVPVSLSGRISVCSIYEGV